MHLRINLIACGKRRGGEGREVEGREGENRKGKKIKTYKAMHAGKEHTLIRYPHCTTYSVCEDHPYLWSFSMVLPSAGRSEMKACLLGNYISQVKEKEKELSQDLGVRWMDSQEN